MLSLSQYERRVQLLQANDSADRDAAAMSLLTEIRNARWQTPKERSAAQNLVARLYRLGQPAPATPPPRRASAPALTGDLLRRWKEKSARQRTVKVG
jgi:hypothetical protein